jgi:hypothetical protein
VPADVDAPAAPDSAAVPAAVAPAGVGAAIDDLPEEALT